MFKCLKWVFSDENTVNNNYLQLFTKIITSFIVVTGVRGVDNPRTQTGYILVAFEAN